MQIQITLISEAGYKPMSTIIEVPDVPTFNLHRKEYQQKAAVKICAQRHMTARDLVKYGYNGVKCRVYDKEKIARENAERYEQIKKERGWA